MLLLFLCIFSFLLSKRRLAGYRERKECDNAIGPHSFLVGEAERRGAKVGRLNENPVFFMQCDNKSQYCCGPDHAVSTYEISAYLFGID